MPRKRDGLKAEARRRCLRKLPTYFATSSTLTAAGFNVLIGVRRLYGTSRYYERFGRLPDYAHPRSYSEKVQWRKLFDRNPMLGIFCDKLASRELARRRVPGIALPDILWCGDDPDAIPLEALQPPFVVKPNNRSGSILFVRTWAELKPHAIRKRCWTWLASPPHGAQFYEWGYRNTVGKIIVERFLSRPGKLLPPPDLKLFVFSGTTQWIYYSDQHENRRGVYTASWEPLPLDRWKGGRRSIFTMEVPAPRSLSAMIAAADAIAADVDHARVDLYEMDGKVFFGEITAYPYSGTATWVHKDSPCEPYPDREIDDAVGARWSLPHVSWPTQLYRGLFG